MQLRNKLHPLMLSSDNLSKLAKKYGHFHIEIPLEAFCRDLSKFTQFEPWQLHQAFYKMLNSQTISWSAFLEILKDDCKTRSTLITQLLDHNQSFSIAIKQGTYDKINYDLKLLQDEEIRQFKRIFLANYSFSTLLLNNELLIIQQKDYTVISKLVFNPILQERKITYHVSTQKSNERQIEKQKSKVQFPSQILSLGLKTSLKFPSEKPKKIDKTQKKSLSFIHDLQQNESVNIGKSLFNDPFDITLKNPSSSNVIKQTDNRSLMKTHFDPWKFVNKMKVLKSQLTYNPLHLPIEKHFKSTYAPKDKQIFNRALTLNKKIATSNISIQSFSVDMQYVAVILTNKQLRLLKLRKYPFNKIVTEVVLVKTFKWFPIYIHLFRTILNDNLHILIAFQSDKITRLRAYRLVYQEDKKNKQQKNGKLIQMYSQELNYAPIYQPMGNLLAMFNQFGQLTVLDLTCRDHDTLNIKVNIRIQNPFLNKTIPISACEYHPPTFTIVIGCKNGYLHTLSQHSPQPKRHKKITNNGEVSALVCGKQYVIALTSDMICLLVNPYSLNEMSRINLNDHQIKKMSRMHKIQESDTIVLYGRNMEQLQLVVNEAKVKQIRRSKYQHLTKVKLLDNQLPPVETINQDVILKVKVTQNHLVIVFENSNLVKVFSSIQNYTSFVPQKQTTSILDISMEKDGNLITLAYDSFEVQVRNIYSQNILWSVMLTDFPNCLIFINKDRKPMVNVNTEEGNVNFIDSKGTLKTIYNTKTSITAAAQIKNSLVVGDCFGSLFVFTDTSMRLLHKINLPNCPGIKIIRDVPKLKIIRVLSFGNTIYDIDIQNAKVLASVSPKCNAQEVVQDITEIGFIQQTIQGIFIGEFDEKKQKTPLRTRISSRGSKNPTTEQTLKSILRMASGISLNSQQTHSVSEQRFISYDQLRIQKDKIKSVNMVMNRLAITMVTCNTIYITLKGEQETINLLN